MSLRMIRIDPLVDGNHEARLVAMEGSLAVGTVAVRYQERLSACIRQLYVLPTLRRGGIGRRLIGACCGIARKAGCHTISLNLARDNESLPFYLRLGFICAYGFDDGDQVLTRLLDGAQLEALLPKGDGGAPYVCPDCTMRLVDLNGVWGCKCSGYPRQSGPVPSGNGNFQLLASSADI